VERRENGNQVFGQAIIELAPTTPLESRWYALTVDPLPAGLRTGPWVVKVGSSGIASRFAIGSDPRLARVHRCLDDKGGGKVVLEFSEPVVTTSMNVSVRADSACSLLLDTVPSTKVYADCETLASTGRLHITLTDIVGASGVSLKNAGDATSLDPALFSPGGTECDVVTFGP
jgi:hypothetical protein